MKTILSGVFLLLTLAVPAAAQQSIFVVRHAERADAAPGASAMMNSDPDLSEAGRARAQSLASMLKDAKISAIYTTQFKRTKQTAEPLAKALGVELTVVDARDLPGLVQKLKTGGNALVVGHSNTVGAIVEGLGVTERVELSEADYDNLFVIVRGEKPTLVRLHFR
jgi:phosphohistidine phosphatase SixA